MRDNLTRDNLKTEVEKWINSMGKQFLKEDVAKYSSRLDGLADVIAGDPVLSMIADAVVVKAAEANYNAGMGGEHGDGGAGMVIEKLKAFLQGVEYGASRDADNLGDYAHLYAHLKRERDPEYLEYLRLKEIYE